jgi:endo-1,4-beta-xylanase
MKASHHIISRQSAFLQLFMLLLLSVFSACGPGVNPTLAPTSHPVSIATLVPNPTLAPTLVPASTEQAMPTPIPPQTKDIPVYRNSFEDITDLSASGITSTNNEVGLNSKNVAYQSGHRSLEAGRTIAGTQYSSLSIEFSVKALTGEDTLDLSNKIIGFSFFIPVGSPITDINLNMKAGSQTVQIPVGGGRPQGEWQYAQIDVKSIYARNAWNWTNAPSSDEARKVVKNCAVIEIDGARNSDGAATATSFLIDDFKWIGLDDINHIPFNDTAASLRQYANAGNMIVGSVVLHSATQHWFDDPWYLWTLTQEFNTVSIAAGEMRSSKPADPALADFDYTYSDQLVAFAEGNGLSIKGATGGWHLLNPAWLYDANYDELKAFVERKVEQDIGRYKGKVMIWDVFNEVVEDGNGFRNRQKKNVGPTDSIAAPYGYSYSPWVDGNDTSLIEAAFVKARAVDPNAKLFLNDYGNEEIGQGKADFFYNFAAGMKKKGVPIDGVGFQLHLIYPNLVYSSSSLENLDAYLTKVDQNIKRYAKAGLLVEFTEFECQIRLDDINLATQAGQAEYARRVKKQAAIYSGFMKLAKDNPNVAAFIIWGVSDKLPGISGYSTSNRPFYTFTFTDSFLFDKNHFPKPAYDAVLDVLKP